MAKQLQIVDADIKCWYTATEEKSQQERELRLWKKDFCNKILIAGIVKSDKTRSHLTTLDELK